MIALQHNGLIYPFSPFFQRPSPGLFQKNRHHLHHLKGGSNINNNRRVSAAAALKTSCCDDSSIILVPERRIRIQSQHCHAYYHRKNTVAGIGNNGHAPPPSTATIT